MSADIDLDFADRKQILKLIKHVPARQESNTESKHHNSGVYVTKIPVDPIHNCTSFDYAEAENRGYFKIDFLNVNVYQHIQSREHYEQLLNATPPWEKLMDKNFCSKIIHISNSYNAIVQMKPDSIMRMAMFLAVIRPAKKHLMGLSWENVANEVWVKTNDNKYFFKKAHSLSYAMLVVLHMNIIDQYS
jgi:hypothetical protein